ncbi:MAG: hypothetical protein H6774_02215 [Pseudomonadales bacterium]|nr:hypothetical protein [Candidatus Woesebacteria bacterium]MCB9801882.1 hypothetical protein [Pseudomonadales bacterium]
MIKKLCFSFCLALGLFLIQPNSEVKANSSLTVSPPVQYIALNPGESRAVEIIITNNSLTELIITPAAVDFTASDKTGQPILSDHTSFPYFSSTSFTEPISLTPTESRVITIPITVDQAAAQNEYHLTVLFQTDSEASGAPRVQNVIGSNIIISIDDGEVLPALEAHLHLPKVVDTFQAIETSGWLTNTASLTQEASGAAEITNWRGSTIGHYNIYPDAALAFSGRPLRFFTDEPLSEETKPMQKMVVSPPLFGVYSVQTLLVSNPSGQTHSAEYIVIAAPFSLLFVATCIICILIFTYKKQKQPTTSTEY